MFVYNSYIYISGGLFQWLIYQAKKGVAGTNAHIGGLLYNGKLGIKKNLAKAFQYFQSASKEELQNSNMQYNVGIMQLKGEGVEVCFSKFHLLFDGCWPISGLCGFAFIYANHRTELKQTLSKIILEYTVPTGARGSSERSQFRVRSEWRPAKPLTIGTRRTSPRSRPTSRAPIIPAHQTVYYKVYYSL